jgi:DNA-cytosine methyltransferase
MNNKSKLKVLDLFAGVGGLSYGLEMAGLKTVAAIEIDKFFAESMKKNNKNVKIFINDIQKINPIEIEKKIGKIDIIVGGPPCQGFSLKGKRGGLKDKRNFLFKEYIDYVRFFKPKYFVLENVPTILSSNKEFFKKGIIKEFTKLNYQVSYGILNSSDFGVPQNRKRAIFIGTSSDKEILLPYKKENKKVTVWEAISDLAYLKSGEGKFCSEYKFEPETIFQKKIRKNSKKLYNHIATNHSKLAIDRLKKIPPEKGKEFLEEKISSTFGQTWGRLEKNKPSPTIITRFDTPSNGKNSHPFLHRAITPREAARLQSFPDTFIFYGNKTSIIKQIGNAVPPLLGRAIGEQILKHHEKDK